MFDQLSSPGTRQVSHDIMPIGNIGNAVALKLLTMYNNFESNTRDGVVFTPIPIDTTATQLPPSPLPCVPQWSCGNWSACAPNGLRTRTCIDFRHCNTLSGRPATVQACTPPIAITTTRPRMPIVGIAPVMSVPVRLPGRTVVVTPIPPPPTPPYVGAPPMGNGNALPLEPPTKPEDDQAAAAEVAKKAKQKWTYIVLFIFVLLVIAYFYFKNRNKIT